MCRTVKWILIVSISVNILGLAALAVMEQQVQLSERVFARLGVEYPVRRAKQFKELEYHPLTSKAVTIHGIIAAENNFESLDRLGNSPLSFRPELKKLGQHMAGVRIRFKTDSSRLHLPVRRISPVSFSTHYLSEQASSGIDLYINREYSQTITRSNIENVFRLKGNSADDELRLIELYLPSFSSIKLDGIGLEPGCKLETAQGFNSSIVFYGTSITQGASAPRPGLTFPAIIARKLATEFYNYGFAGNGQGDPGVAALLAESGADIYVLEYSRQASAFSKTLEDNLVHFCELIKEKQPEASIIILTSFYDTSEKLGYSGLEARREAFRIAFQRLEKLYDKIYLVEGVDLLGPDDSEQLVDGTHPNAIGMNEIAMHLLPVLAPLVNSRADP